MELNLNISEFGFTDLLSIFVAFFAIALSVAFYFKATDTSNRFYDNSYAFTKDVSEILGRMEAGFGERLRHLDEGYIGIRDRFDRLPFDSTKAMEEIEKETEEIRKKETELQDALEYLAQKAHLEANEKEELFERMQVLNKELEESKIEARRLKKRLENQLNNEQQSPESMDVIRYLYRKIADHNAKINLDSKFKPSYRAQFSNVKENLHPMAIRELQLYGFLDNESELTTKGVNALRLVEHNFD